MITKSRFKIKLISSAERKFCLAFRSQETDQWRCSSSEIKINRGRDFDDLFWKKQKDDRNSFQFDAKSTNICVLNAFFFENLMKLLSRCGACCFDKARMLLRTDLWCKLIVMDRTSKFSKWWTKNTVWCVKMRLDAKILI